MQPRNLNLNDRDKEILLLLKEQGFASFDQLTKRFFTTKQAASRRLINLEAFFYIKSILAKSFLAANNPQTSYFPYLQSAGITASTKIYYLDSIFRRQFPETNRLLKKDLCLHQLLLNDVRFYLEDNFSEEKIILNDPDHKILAGIDITKRKEFAPDLTVLGENYTIAVELERTAKGQNRYQQKFWHYEDSSYTHVLYFYVNEAHLPMLLKYSGLGRKFAFAHFLKPEVVISNTFGHMSLKNWIETISRIEDTNGRKN